MKKMISALPGAIVLSLVLGASCSILLNLLMLQGTVYSNFTNAAVRVVIGAVIIIVIIFVLYYLIYGIYIGAYIRRYYYDASEQFLTIQKRVFSPTEIHVPYQKIQDVYVDQDILDRMMGLYDVHIASATVTSGIEAHIDGVDADVAEKLKVFLLGKIQYGSAYAVPAAASVAAPDLAQQVVPAVAPPAAGVFSSANYPIDSKWLVSATFGNILTSFVLVVFIVLFFRGALLVFPLLLAALFVIIFIAKTIWTVLWRQTYYFEFQSQFILLRRGVLRREEKHVPYRSVQNVLSKQGIVDRMIGLSTVVIENAAQGMVYSSRMGRTGSRDSQIVIPGQPVAKGKQLADELNRILGGNNASTTGL